MVVEAATRYVADYSIRLRILKELPHCDPGPDSELVADYSIRLRILKDEMGMWVKSVRNRCRLLDPIADTESSTFLSVIVLPLVADYSIRLRILKDFALSLF